MNFASFAFLALLAVVLAARVTIGRRKTEPAFVGVLLASSLVFYAWHVPIYLAILLTSTTIDYVAGRRLARIDERGEPNVRLAARMRRHRKGLLALSLSANLGLLASFKYAGFLTENLEVALGAIGLPWRAPTWGLLLPMGISFYTFQSMSYTIDVYRRAITPAPSFATFLLYVSFFPQLVAGPIVRASEFLPQLARPRRLRWASFTEGAFLLTSGYFLKVVCADNLGSYVDANWARAGAPGASSTFALWLAVSFAGQIFADFAGYSNIARGLAYLMGYRLPVNFDLPYIAGSFKEFWQRWHITLSRWLRDYLYVSLGGNRVTPGRTYVNLAVVMLLGGLWHGAAWTFVAWGAIHGIGLAIERRLGLHRHAVGIHRVMVGAAWAVVVQGLVLVSWVVFRSDSIGQAWQVLLNIARLDFDAPTATIYATSLFLAPLVLWHAWGWAVAREWTTPLAVRPRAALAAAMTAAVLASYGSTGDFIYFQF